MKMILIMYVSFGVQIINIWYTIYKFSHGYSIILLTHLMFLHNLFKLSYFLKGIKSSYNG